MYSMYQIAQYFFLVSPFIFIFAMSIVLEQLRDTFHGELYKYSDACDK